MASTIRPNVSAIPTWETSPPVTSSMTIAPVPAKTSAKVPRHSAMSFLAIDLRCRGLQADLFAPLLNLRPDLVANEPNLFEFCGFTALHLRRIREAPMQPCRGSRENGALLRAGLVAHANDIGEKLAGYEDIEDSLRFLF